MPNRSQLKAIKILTQYQRLAKKYDINLSEKKIEFLNKLRSQGIIKITNLPAKLRTEFPGEFSNMTLNEIREIEN